MWISDDPAGAYATVYNLPEGETVTSASSTFRDAEDCGAGDRYSTYSSGLWSMAEGVYSVPVDEQSMAGGVGQEHAVSPQSFDNPC